MRHPHADLIIAWANGAKIEFKGQASGEWQDCPSQPAWWDDSEYRIKPEPKPDVVANWNVQKDGIRLIQTAPANLRLTFDGETGKLKSAEVIA
jgi:hypothetical protein